MNVLVTGASGFVGVDLTKKLLDEGYTVYALVRDKKKLARGLPPNYPFKPDWETTPREVRCRLSSA